MKKERGIKLMDVLKLGAFLENGVTFGSPRQLEVRAEVLYQQKSKNHSQGEAIIQGDEKTRTGSNTVRDKMVQEGIYYLKR